MFYKVTENYQLLIPGLKNRIAGCFVIQGNNSGFKVRIYSKGNLRDLRKVRPVKLTAQEWQTISKCDQSLPFKLATLLNSKIIIKATA